MNPQPTPAVPAGTTGSGRSVEAPGMSAIASTLQRLYQGRQPTHFDNPHRLKLGGDDPLDGISVYQRAEPIAHWHYVTYGFSDLFSKHSSDPAVSGFGFELTLRVAAEPGASEPPAWPLHLLQSLGRYVFRTGNGFHEGHRISIDGPISLGSPTELTALAFAFDPELRAIDTPFGHVAFLQVIGLTTDEEQFAQRWETRKLLAALLPHMPLWITHLARNSLLAKPDVKAALDDGMRKNGSSSAVIYADVLDIDEKLRFLRKPLIDIALGARQLQQLVDLLPLRLPFGNTLTIAGPTWKLHLEPGRRNRVRFSDGALHLRVNLSTVAELATLLLPRQGVYRLPSFQHIAWDVKQTWIRNAQGELVGVIG